MPERRFTCETSDNLYDPAYNSVSLEAEALFNRMLLCSDRWGELCADPRAIMGECMAMRIGTDAVNLEKVTEWLAQLASAGLIHYFEGRLGRFIRIEERLRYRRAAGKKPKWSGGMESSGFDDQQAEDELPDDAEFYEQTEMPLPVVHSTKPVHPLEAENIRKRVNQKKKKIKNESTRARGKKAVPAAAPQSGEDSGTRAVSAGIPEGLGEAPPPRSLEVKRFLFDLGEVLYAHEVQNEVWTNAGMWIERYHHNPLAMAGAISDLKNRLNNRSEKPVESTAKWLTKRFFELAPPIQRAA